MAEYPSFQGLAIFIFYLQLCGHVSLFLNGQLEVFTVRIFLQFVSINTSVNFMFRSRKAAD